MARSPERTVLIVLAYLWLLAPVPLLLAGEDVEVRWHARHGLVLLVAELALWLALTVVGAALGAVPGSPVWMVSLLTPFALLGLVAVHALCIVAGLRGKRFLIPNVSQYADRF
jgi:uncharacterized membrane protein